MKAKNLIELTSQALALCDDTVSPARIERICLHGKWVVIMLDDGRCGRAFLFSGEHAVYGSYDASCIEGLKNLIGLTADEVADWVFENDTLKNSATNMMRKSVLVATINALASPLNATAGLIEHGASVLPDADYSFIHPDDHVVVVGAGMAISEAVDICGHVEIVDMRPLASLQSILIDAAGVMRGPSGMHFNAVDATPRLFAQADIIFITGCTIVNETFFDLMELPRNARELVLFGPSAQAPFTLLADHGVTRIITSRVIDGPQLMHSMLDDFFGKTPEGCIESYTIDIRHLG